MTTPSAAETDREMIARIIRAESCFGSRTNPMIGPGLAAAMAHEILAALAQRGRLVTISTDYMCTCARCGAWFASKIEGDRVCDPCWHKGTVADRQTPPPVSATGGEGA